MNLQGAGAGIDCTRAAGDCAGREYMRGDEERQEISLDFSIPAEHFMRL